MCVRSVFGFWCRDDGYERRIEPCRASHAGAAVADALAVRYRLTLFARIRHRAVKIRCKRFCTNRLTCPCTASVRAMPISFMCRCHFIGLAAARRPATILSFIRASEPHFNRSVSRGIATICSHSLATSGQTYASEHLAMDCPPK